MRHGNVNRKFGRTSGQRKALLKSLARSLVLRGRITTTQARAKEIRPLVEKMVTRGRTDSLQNRRLLTAALGDVKAAHKLIAAAKNYADRKGGYLRIVK